MILAGVEFLNSIGDAFREVPNTRDLMLLAAAGLTLVLIIAIGSRLFGREHKRPGPAPDYLTLAVDLLELPEESRRELLALAEDAGMREPACMLLSPANLEVALNQAEARISRPRRRARIEGLCQRLFNEPLPGASGRPELR